MQLPPRSAIDKPFPAILTNNWCLDKKANPEIKVGHDNLFKKYKAPENCMLGPLLGNKDVSKLLSANQRDADIKFLSMQKSLSEMISTALTVL